MIKLGNNDITLKVGSNDVSAAYLGSTLVYSGSTPPTPSFNGKWLATYSDSHTESAECDASSAITRGNINLTNLESVVIGDCVTEIGAQAFENTISLTSVTIGDGVVIIGGQSFRGCSSLATFTIKAVSPPTLGNKVFNSNFPIYVPSGSVSAYQSAWPTYASRIQAIP